MLVKRFLFPPGLFEIPFGKQHNYSQAASLSTSFFRRYVFYRKVSYFRHYPSPLNSPAERISLRSAPQAALDPPHQSPLPVAIDRIPAPRILHPCISADSSQQARWTSPSGLGPPAPIRPVPTAPSAEASRSLSPPANLACSSRITARAADGTHQPDSR